MRRVLHRFIGSKDGFFAAAAVLTMVPLMLAVGLSTDYSMEASTRSAMQNALDAATQSLTTMPRTATGTERQKKLQDGYSANGGTGTVILLSSVFDPTGPFMQARRQTMPCLRFSCSLPGSIAFRDREMQLLAANRRDALYPVGLPEIILHPGILP